MTNTYAIPDRVVLTAGVSPSVEIGSISTTAIPDAHMQLYTRHTRLRCTVHAELVKPQLRQRPNIIWAHHARAERAASNDPSQQTTA